MSNNPWRVATRWITLLHLCIIPIAIGVTFILGKLLDLEKGSNFLMKLINRESFYAVVWHYWGLMYIFFLMAADIVIPIILLISTLNCVKSSFGIITSLLFNMLYAATITVFCFYTFDSWFFLVAEATWRMFYTGIAWMFLRERENIPKSYFSNVPISNII